MTYRPRSGLSGSLFLVVVVAGCRSADDPPPPPTGAAVRVDGSSTVYLISKIVAEEAVKHGLPRADVHESGTTGGLQRFCAGELDVTGASRPIQQGEIDACRAAGIDFIELPIGYDGLAVVVNAANDWVDHLSVGELKSIWAPAATGSITTWNRVRVGFPDRPLHLFGPGPQSGTFDYFTQAIVGEQRASRTDFTGSEDDTVLVSRIADDVDALGYFGIAYLRGQPKLRAVPIDDGDPNNGAGPVSPSPHTVANGTYQPLSRPLFIYVNAAASQRPGVDRFVTFYLQVVRELSAEIGYVALPLATDQLVAARYRARRTGTLFGGKAPLIGVPMQALLDGEQR